MTGPGTLRVALVGRGFATAVHRAAWSAAEAWTGVAARVVLEVPCWRQAVSHPGVDVVDLCGPGQDDMLGAVTAAASAGRHVVLGDLAAVSAPAVLSDPAAVRGPSTAEVPPSWAVQAGGWTVVDLPHRCVPAVSFARAIVAAGDIGAPRHVRVSGVASLAVVDLVRTLTGHRFAAATHAADRGRLDGLLHGGCTVAVRPDGPGRAAADVQVEISGTDATIRIDLQRPLTVEVAADDQVARRLRPPVAPHPYPAVFGPPGHPCRARLAAEHLVVDVVEAVAHGREDVPCLGDVLEALRVLGPRPGPDGAAHRRRRDAAAPPPPHPENAMRAPRTKPKSYQAPLLSTS